MEGPDLMQDVNVRNVKVGEGIARCNCSLGAANKGVNAFFMHIDCHYCPTVERSGENGWRIAVSVKRRLEVNT